MYDNDNDNLLVCPHCRIKGYVETKRKSVRKGVSGAKLAAAFITCGLSVLAVGLSRFEDVTRARCRRCDSRWEF
jgi:hypothetical protein